MALDTAPPTIGALARSVNSLLDKRVRETSMKPR
jgi:hypothetical protein